MIDRRLLEHWQRQNAARRQLRAALPPSWRDDPRPKMDEVRELFIEGMLRMRGPTAPMVAAIGDDDR